MKTKVKCIHATVCMSIERVQTHIKNIMSMHAFNGWYNSNNDNDKCKGRCNTINVHLIISIYRQRETGNSLDLITAKYIHSNWKWTQLSDKSFVNEQMVCVSAWSAHFVSNKQASCRQGRDLAIHSSIIIRVMWRRKKKPPSAFSLLPKIIWRTWSSLSLPEPLE